MDVSRYYHLVVMSMLDYESWRYGQALYNVLDNVRPDLAARIVGSDTDPFHASKHYDPRIIRFHDFIANNW